MIIFVCVTHATMDLPVTCYAQIIVHSVLMGNVIVDLRVGGETTARGKDVLDIRKIAQDMDNVCLQKRVSVIQAGVVMAVRKRTVQVIQIATIEASASQQIPLIVATVSTGGQG